MSRVSIRHDAIGQDRTRWASSVEASPRSAATSIAAAASTHSPLATVKALALSAEWTRPAPSAQLQADAFAGAQGFRLGASCRESEHLE